MRCPGLAVASKEVVLEEPGTHGLGALCRAGEGVPSSHRLAAYADGTVTVPVYQRGALRAGHEIAGPALVEEAASVTVLNPGQKLVVDDWGHLLVAAAADQS